MNNDQNKGVTGAAKTVVRISSSLPVPNYITPVYPLLRFTPSIQYLTCIYLASSLPPPPGHTPTDQSLRVFQTGILGNTVSGVSNTVGGVVGGATRGLGETVNGLTGGVGRPVGDGLANVGTGVENGLSDVAKGSRDAGNWKK